MSDIDINMPEHSVVTTSTVEVGMPPVPSLAETGMDATQVGICIFGFSFLALGFALLILMGRGKSD